MRYIANFIFLVWFIKNIILPLKILWLHILIINTHCNLKIKQERNLNIVKRIIYILAYKWKTNIAFNLKIVCNVTLF